MQAWQALVVLLLAFTSGFMLNVNRQRQSWNKRRWVVQRQCPFIDNLMIMSCHDTIREGCFITNSNSSKMLVIKLTYDGNKFDIPGGWSLGEPCLVGVCSVMMRSICSEPDRRVHRLARASHAHSPARDLGGVRLQREHWGAPSYRA